MNGMMKRIALLLLTLLFCASAFAEGSAVQVSYLGPEGTYTEEAARFWFTGGEALNPKATVNDAVTDVLSGDADFAVIPQENTLGGAVVNYVDALIAAEDAFVVGEVVLPISQTLMGVPGATLGDIKTVCSHAQGLTQSAAWRSEHLPDAEAQEMPSTAAAASYVAEQGDKTIAAVAAPGAAPLYGLEVLSENVQITDANKTRFYVLSAQPLMAEGLTRAVFVATCEGSRIEDIIVALREAGLEIVSLHDRPEGSRLGMYHYVIEVEDEAGIADAQVESVSALEGVRFAGRFNAAEKRPKSMDYTLDRVVVLSRHNIRSPLSGSGSLLGDITPHKWFDWTSAPSELSLRGAMLETLMGQYFRLWLEDEGLFPENYQPEEGAVRFYANAKQRTLATAHYFSAGLLPVAVVPVESHAEYDTMDPTFNPVLTFVTDDYAKDAVTQIAEKGGVAGLEGIHAGLLDAIELLMDVTDMNESEAYKSGQFGDLLTDETTIQLELGKEPGMTGPIKTATNVADALTFQFYEMADDRAAAFGHDLTRDDWLKLHSIVDAFVGTLFEAPLISVNVAHPLLEEIRSELTAEGRKFSFLCGHDSNVASVLSALGVEEYMLPDTVEPRTPIGVKLVFETWSAEDGEAYVRVRLVYQSTGQLRGITPLSLENPPMSFDIDLPGLERNVDGYYRLDDVLGCFQNAIDAYDALIETYGGDNAETDAAA